MSAWPATLPQQFEQEGYEETFPQVTIRTEMDVGPAKVRKRYTAAIKPFVGFMFMTPEQVDTLETFFETTTAYGSLAFDWEHPRTGDPVSCRFVGEPQLEAVEGGDFKVTIQIEVLP
jgi:hypothetical protein